MIFPRFVLLVALLLLSAWCGDASLRGRGARSNGGSHGRGRIRRCSGGNAPIRDARDKPNFVIFFADDMGYGDLASYGHPTQERGPIDDVMVENGIKFTQGYVPDTVCTPSRVALLTGVYQSKFKFS